LRFVLRVFVIVLAAALLLAGWDFSRFVARADRAVSPDPPVEAEAVASLTGASDARIISAVQLADSLDLPLLISGVNVDATPADIARVAKVDVDKIDCCVTLGKAAASTEGNGDEVADWARRNKVDRIIVVTSEYHMERALFELKRAMPEGHFIPHAVMTTKVRPSDWYRDTATAKTLIEEWIKYRLAGLRNAALNPESGA
jgi:uncharacterized SAM-binding protein YcdF (DUF218 family)